MEPELGTIPHYGESLSQELLVLGVAPVGPQVAGVPYVGNEVVVAPGAHAVVERSLGEYAPAIAIVVALAHFLPTGTLGTTQDEVNERLVQVREVGNLCGPVVHLDVDVGMDIRVPGRFRATVVPDTLQVVGSSNGLAVRTDSQVAAEVEVELFQEQVVVGSACAIGVLGVVVVYQSLGVNRGSLQAHVEGHALGNSGEVLDVSRLNSLVALGTCSLYSGLNLFINSFRSNRVEVACCIGIAIEVGCTLKIEGYVSGILHGNTLSRRGNGSALVGNDMQTTSILDSHLTCERSHTVLISNSVGTNTIARFESEHQVHLVLTLSLVLCSDYLVGSRAQVLA